MMNFYVISFSVTTLITTLIVNRLMNGNSTSMIVLYCFSNLFNRWKVFFFNYGDNETLLTFSLV